MSSPILCVDRYQKTWKAPGTPVRPIQLSPRPIQTGAPTQAGRFTSRGPSSGGPFTYTSHRGITWGGQETWGVTSTGTGHNLGLG